MALSFSYQGYYDFIDDYKAKDCRNVIMNSTAIQNTDYIQNENWVSSVIGYIDNTHYTQDPEHDYKYYYDIFNWSTDEKIGVMYCPDNAPDGSITINGTTYNFTENDFGLNIFDDGEDNKLYIFDDGKSSADIYIRPTGPRNEGITPYFYDLITENPDNHEFRFIFGEDGGWFGCYLLWLLDLTDEILYADLENDLEGSKHMQFKYAEDPNYIYLPDGSQVDITTNNCAYDRSDGDFQVYGICDDTYYGVYNNGKEPIVKKPINIYRSFWNKYCEGEYVEIYGFRQEAESQYITLPMLLINMAGDDGSKCCIYIDSTTNWVEYFEQDNLFESAISGSLESVPVDEYYEINIIDDPVGGEMMTRINMENRDRKLPKGGFA